MARYDAEIQDAFLFLRESKDDRFASGRLILYNYLPFAES